MTDAPNLVIVGADFAGLFAVNVCASAAATSR